jgi:hypothetical protein
LQVVTITGFCSEKRSNVHNKLQNSELCKKRPSLYIFHSDF